MNPDALIKLKLQLTTEEGKRYFVYNDSLGVPSIGIGRNLRDVGLSDDEVQYLFNNDLTRALNECALLPYWHELTDNRQIAVADMIYNLGYKKFLGFVKFNSDMLAGYYKSAKAEMLDSLWARQVGKRANILADMIEKG